MVLGFLIAAVVTALAPPELTGAWSLVSEWTAPTPTVAADAQLDVLVEILAPQDNLVIMQRGTEMVVVDDGGRARTVTARWDHNVFCERIAIGGGVTLDRTFARTAPNRLAITIVLLQAHDRRTLSRRMYELVE